MPVAELPRQTYKSESDADAESAVADAFAAWAKATHLKVGRDPVEEQKSRVDRALVRDGAIVAFFEIKSVNHSFRSTNWGWATGRRKWEALRALKAIVRVPVLFVFHFKKSNTIAYLDADEDFTIKPNFGRDDRGDPADREEGVCFQWPQFRLGPYAAKLASADGFEPPK